jgi:hypothetical protein
VRGQSTLPLQLTPAPCCAAMRASMAQGPCPWLGFTVLIQPFADLVVGSDQRELPGAAVDEMPFALDARPREGDPSRRASPTHPEIKDIVAGTSRRERHAGSINGHRSGGAEANTAIPAYSRTLSGSTTAQPPLTGVRGADPQRRRT